MEFRLLGPLEVRHRGAVIPLGTKQRKTVLALLLINAGEAVTTDRLIDELWGDHPSPSARKTVQAHAAHLRRSLNVDGSLLSAAGNGYMIAPAPGAVDVDRFEELAAEGRRLLVSSPADASAAFSQALGLFRGSPLADLADEAPALRMEAGRLTEERLSVTLDLLEADLANGNTSAVARRAEGMVAAHPLEERAWGILMLALYRSGRQSEALRAFSRLRHNLAEELGINPSPALVRLEQQILDQDSALEVAPPATIQVQTEPSPGRLPSGQVTFLFSDIQGSTRLLDRFGPAYLPILERHRQLLRESWADYGGHELGTEGDSFFVVFGDADSAVAAAVAGHRRLAAENWPDEGVVRVRMGMHSGIATPYRGSYVALAAHQAERVMAAAHGGQALVTQTTADALRENGEIHLLPLGRFRLRDFPEDVRLYQVTAPGLTRDFPAVRALPSGGHNIVKPPTETIGREQTVADLGAQVAPGRLITLIGPGGVGKTRVAAELAMQIAPAWDDGVWMTDLAGVGKGSRVAGAIAAAIGAPVGRTTDRWDDVLSHLETKSTVLLLDNCEHLALTCRDLARSLLAHCPAVAVVATSRQPLHAPGERLWPIQPLTPPGTRSTLEEVAASPAARLFLQRASDHNPGFGLDEQNAETIAEICRRLDGLPLLTELAAAHVGKVALQEILSGLHKPELLTSPDPGAVHRHQTVAAMLDWGLRLLKLEEQAAFRRLSIFRSGFTVEAAASALGVAADDTVSPARLVWSLVDRSLIASDQSANQTRYRFLNTIRMYGQSLLDEDERIEVAKSVSDWYLDVLGPWHAADRAWIGRVGEEIDNLRALVPLLSGDHHETAQQLACTIARYHDASQSFRDGIQEITDLVASLTGPSPARVALLTALADLYLRTGEVEPARQLVEQADALRGQTGNPAWDEVGVDRSRGEIARRTGDLEGAIGVARETLTRRLGDRARSRMLNLLGTTAAALADYETAYEACAEELELSERLGYEVYIASAHGNLAEVAMRKGDMPAAARHQRACLELALALGSQALIAFSLVVAARVAGWRQEWEEATLLHANADQLLDEVGLALYDDDAQASADMLESAKAALGAGEYEAARAEGQSIDVMTAAERADRVLADAQAPARQNA